MQATRMIEETLSSTSTSKYVAVEGSDFRKREVGS